MNSPYNFYTVHASLASFVDRRRLKMTLIWRGISIWICGLCSATLAFGARVNVTVDASDNRIIWSDSNTTARTATFNFTGTAIYALGYDAARRSTFAPSPDGGNMTSPYYAPVVYPVQSQILFSADNLPNVPHTLLLENVCEASDANCTLPLDYMMYTTDQPAGYLHPRSSGSAERTLVHRRRRTHGSSSSHDASSNSPESSSNENGNSTPRIGNSNANHNSATLRHGARTILVSLVVALNTIRLCTISRV